MTEPAGETEHRGIRWRREPAGGISFYDPGASEWVPWAPGVDAPPRPPGWEPARTRPTRPGWRTPWRIVPVVFVVVVVVIAFLQAVRPSGNSAKKEAAATAALRGKCLAQHGTAEGHPKYAATPVPCASTAASVQVTEVVPSDPGSPPCPAGTTGFSLAYAGVEHPHILCVQPLRGG